MKEKLTKGEKKKKMKKRRKIEESGGRLKKNIQKMGENGSLKLKNVN